MKSKDLQNMSPEIFLRELNRRINKLYLDSLVFGDSSLGEEIKNLLKKTIVSEMFNEKYIIAVAGLQGVGKSTIMKILYNLPDDIIPETRNIGEKIPVLVTEWDENYYGFKGKVIEVDDKNIEIKDIIIKNSEVFLELSRNPSMEYIVLELMVPRKFFKTYDKSFILLPGLGQAADSWNSLAEHVLYSAASCILVFNEQRLNDPNNANLLENVRREFKGAKPIVTLTFGDESKDCNLTLKKTFINQFNIPSEEEDRVVRTSTREEEMPRWCNEIIHALEKYSHIEKEFRLKQIEMLDELLVNDFNKIIDKIEKMNCSIDLFEDSESKRAVKMIMKTVNKRKESIRKYYHKQIEDEIDIISANASLNMRDYIKEESTLKKIRKQIFSESIKDMEEFNDSITNSWNSAQKNKLKTIPSEVILRTIYNEYPEVKQIPEYMVNSLAEAEVAVTSISTISARKIKKSREKIERSIKDITLLFTNKGNGSISNEVKESTDYIALLALHMMFELDTDVNNLKEVQYADLNYKNNVEMNNLLVNATNQHQNILNGIAAVLGIDAADGTGNIIQTMFSVLGIKISAAASVAITGVLGAGIVGINVVSKLNKSDVRTLGYSKAIIGSIKEALYTDMRDKFDDFIEKIFDRIEKQLEEGYGLNEGESRYLICQKDLSEAKSFSLELRESINGYRCYLA
ncbi:hypothetical protein LL037_21210 [Clostridium estertheticum]|uniref:hypothetical protein n=1 Tax=Clostridium estertheticum TaxID=238834 RepID=UPI001C0AD50F|nr:hypothetical protein [Clostridium estertheticum]MBU3198264.1 hypothetical protein [Clostridium estertheticum]WAG64955.1 hypothetical protein LL037_21210 [Clostridium estertheticum]